MRICFVSRRFFPAVSGMSVYAHNLLRELVKAGHDVTLISQFRGDEAGVRIYGGGPPPAIEGVKVIGLRSWGEENGGDFERDVDDMAATIIAEHEQDAFDIVHAQYAYPNGWAALLAAETIAVPVVVSIQGGDGHWIGSCCDTHRVAMERVITGADALVIGGLSFLTELTGRLDVPVGRFRIVPGGVDVARFTPATVKRTGPVRILYHGRVDRRKGVLDFVEAIARLRTLGIDFTSTVSGIGPDQNAARARADFLKLEPRTVCFSGAVAYDDVASVYRGADIFVSPTYAEGFSNTILEAMASGVTIASCDTVGVNDCLRHGENALLSRPGDIEALTDHLRRLIEDDALRQQLADAALHECRRMYSWPRVSEMIVEIYDAVKSSTRRPTINRELPIADCRFRSQPHLL